MSCLVQLVALTALVPNAAAQAPDGGLGGSFAHLYQFAPQAHEHAGKLAQRVDFDGITDPTTTLLDALNSLSRRHKITLDLNGRAFKEAGYADSSALLRRPVAPTPLPGMKDVALSVVLRAVLDRFPTGAETTWIIRLDYIEITTRRRATLDARHGVDQLLRDLRARLSCARLGDVRLYTVDAAYRLGEISYWLTVVRDNVRPLTADERARPEDKPGQQKGR